MTFLYTTQVLFDSSLFTLIMIVQGDPDDSNKDIYDGVRRVA